MVVPYIVSGRRSKAVNSGGPQRPVLDQKGTSWARTSDRASPFDIARPITDQPGFEEAGIVECERPVRYREGTISAANSGSNPHSFPWTQELKSSVENPLFYLPVLVTNFPEPSVDNSPSAVLRSPERSAWPLSNDLARFCPL